MSGEIERKALYPGSFDPPTNGHKWVIEKVAGQFDKGYVAVGFNPEKKGRFSVPEREEMLKEIVAAYRNLSVTSFNWLLQVDFAEMLGANYIVRGARNSSDFGFESDIGHLNRTINPNIETIFLTPPNELLQVRSSVVMGLVGFEGWEDVVRNMVPESVMKRLELIQQEKDKEFLRGRFRNLCLKFSADRNCSEVFNDLYLRYQEPHRSYHRPSHIKICLNELEPVREFAQDPNALEFALFYHDAVYDSAKGDLGSDDEGKSADLAEKDITQKLGLSCEFARRVAALILATKHRDIPLESDHKLIADIDLAIFGRSARLFDIYERQIREEYSWVSWEEFASARKRILQRFLDRGVYLTPFFVERYERQATLNLKRSIDSLQKT
jgi:pantetheine-phosphate adenylyltransferase